MTLRSELLNDRTGTAPRRNGTTLGSTRSPLRIWLVDDNQDFRELLVKLLGTEPGYECAGQFSSAEALLEALVRETPPDVILLDIEMRGRSGLDALRSIRTLASATRVLILTTFNDTYNRARALREGAADFVLKSSAGNIFEHIRRAMETGLTGGCVPSVGQEGRKSGDIFASAV